MYYRDRFPRRAIFPVIHVNGYEKTQANVQIAVEAMVDGVFLIDHSQRDPDSLAEIIAWLLDIQGWGEEIWIGANFLGSDNIQALKLAGELGLKGLWTDNAGRFGLTNAPWKDQLAAELEAQIAEAAETLYFGGVAFKYQQQPEDIEGTVVTTMGYLDVLTTSGPGTGQAADLEKLRAMRQAADDHPIAVASGVDESNVAAQLEFVDAVLVASSINVDGDFYRIDPAKLRRLVAAVRSYEPPS